MIRKRTLADKSVYQLAKEKKKPISPDKIETMYRITNTGDILLNDTGKPATYQYVAPENVIDMTQEEHSFLLVYPDGISFLLGAHFSFF